MNNAKIAIDNVLKEEEEVDTSPMLREKETRIMETITALDEISQSNYWQVLKQNVFDGVLDGLKRRLSNAKDTTEMFRLQGQIAWAEKYSDLTKMSEIYRKELEVIKKKLHE